MFGKNLLSLVALIFAGIQISSVSATCNPSYESPNCVATGCLIGEVGYYFVTGNVLVKVTAADTCSKVTEPGFYKALDNKYYSVDKNGAAAEVTSSSGNNTPGQFDSADDSLILVAGKKLTMAASGNYLFTDANQVFTSDPTSTVVLKSDDASSIVLKKDLTTGYEYCLTSDQTLVERDAGYCASKTCDGYYTCNTNGVCTEAADICKAVVDGSGCNVNAATAATCPEGYYLQKSDTATALEDNTSNAGNLYHCNGSTQCTAADETVGYYKNAGNASNGDVPYIKCDGTDCKPMNVVSVGNSGNCASSINAAGTGITLAVGDVITDGTDFFICLATTEAGTIPLDTTVTAASPDSYFISINAANVFGDASNKYVAIDLSKGNAILETTETSTVPPRYLYTSTAFKITAKGGNEEMCGKNATPVNGKILEFKHSDCVDDHSVRVAQYEKLTA